MIAPKCINGKKAVVLCFSDICINSNPFVCGGCNNYKCKSNHKNCMMFEDWITFKDNLQQSNKMIDLQINHISKVVEKTLNNSIKCLQQELNNFYLWKSNFGLKKQITDFFKCIQQNKQTKYTGRNICHILQEMKTQRQSEKINQKKCQQRLDKIMDKIEDIRDILQQLYELWQNKSKPNIPEIKQQIEDQYFQKLNEKLSKLQEKPHHLELKACIIQFSVFIYQFSLYKLNDNKGYIIIYQDGNVLANQIRVGYKFIQELYLFNLRWQLEIDQEQLMCELACKKIMIEMYCQSQVIQGRIWNNPEGTFFINLAVQLLGILEFKYINSDVIQIRVTKGCMDIIKYQLKQLAISLQNPRLKTLRTLKLYYPWTIGHNGEDIECEKAVANSLQKLPELQSFTIITHNIKSLEGYKSLGKKLKAIKDQGWRDYDKP